jgi:hypothetical protein
MLTRAFQFLLAACLVTGAVADDPFVGEWKLNLAALAILRCPSEPPISCAAPRRSVPFPQRSTSTCPSS